MYTGILFFFMSSYTPVGIITHEKTRKFMTPEDSADVIFKTGS